MTRQALACPSCGRVLAYKRHGGSVVPEPSTYVRPNFDGNTFLYCGIERCRGLVVVSGSVVAITPRRHGKLAAN